MPEKKKKPKKKAMPGTPAPPDVVVMPAKSVVHFDHLSETQRDEFFKDTKRKQLTPIQRKFLDEMICGNHKSVKAAAMAAGYAEESASRAMARLSPQVRALMIFELDRVGLNPQTFAQLELSIIKHGNSADVARSLDRLYQIYQIITKGGKTRDGPEETPEGDTFNQFNFFGDPNARQVADEYERKLFRQIQSHVKSNGSGAKGSDGRSTAKTKKGKGVSKKSG